MKSLGNAFYHALSIFLLDKKLSKYPVVTGILNKKYEDISKQQEQLLELTDSEEFSYSDIAWLKEYWAKTIVSGWKETGETPNMLPSSILDEIYKSFYGFPKTEEDLEILSEEDRRGLAFEYYKSIIDIQKLEFAIDVYAELGIHSVSVKEILEMTNVEFKKI